MSGKADAYPIFRCSKAKGPRTALAGTGPASTIRMEVELWANSMAVEHMRIHGVTGDLVPRSMFDAVLARIRELEERLTIRTDELERARRDGRRGAWA